MCNVYGVAATATATAESQAIVTAVVMGMIVTTVTGVMKVVFEKETLTDPVSAYVEDFAANTEDWEINLA